MRVLVTGANGFIGRTLVDLLHDGGNEVVAAVRGARAATDIETPGVRVVQVGDIGAGTDWRASLDGVDQVVHLAATTHTSEHADRSVVARFRKVNKDGSQRLAEQAVAAGVNRFVYMSSIKVNGEYSPCDAGGRPHAFTGDDPPCPRGPYGITKHEAEQAIITCASRSDMRAVVLRPPLVYGPGQRANMLRLMRLVDRGVPLPLGAIENRRSLIYVANLADAVCAVLRAAPDVRGTFTLADTDFSTPDLICAMARALGRRARLWRCPRALLYMSAALVGKPFWPDKLCGSLVVDSEPFRQRFDWRPPVSTELALEQTARWYRKTCN